MHPRVAALIALSLPVTAACSSSSAPPSPGTPPPSLIATWVGSTTQPGNPGASGTMTVQFQRTTDHTDQTGSLTVLLDLKYDGPSGHLAGCHSKVSLPGTFSTDGVGLHAMLAMGNSYPDGCINPSDDWAPGMPIVPNFKPQPTEDALTGPYSLSSDGKTLTIHATTLTRQ